MTKVNARLIAEAPAMLDALRAIVDRAGLGSIHETDQLTGETFYDPIKNILARLEA